MVPIGIGAGPDCDGQVLVLHDLLGITLDFSPRFLRRYLNLAEDINGAITSYCEDVRSGDFPNDSESYTSCDCVVNRYCTSKGAQVNAHCMPESVTKGRQLLSTPQHRNAGPRQEDCVHSTEQGTPA